MAGSSNKPTKWFSYLKSKPSRTGFYECECGEMHYYSIERAEWFRGLSSFKLQTPMAFLDSEVMRWRGLQQPWQK